MNLNWQSMMAARAPLERLCKIEGDFWHSDVWTSSKVFTCPRRAQLGHVSFTLCTFFPHPVKPTLHQLVEQLLVRKFAVRMKSNAKEQHLVLQKAIIIQGTAGSTERLKYSTLEFASSVAANLNF